MAVERPDQSFHPLKGLPEHGLGLVAGGVDEGNGDKGSHEIPGLGDLKKGGGKGDGAQGRRPAPDRPPGAQEAQALDE